MDTLWKALIVLFSGLLIMNLGRGLTGEIDSFAPLFVSGLGLPLSFAGLIQSPIENRK